MPKFRDLNVPALVKVESANNGSNTIIFNIDGTTPFAAHQVCIYGDSSNPALHFDYVVVAQSTPGAQVQATGFPDSRTATGGYLGTQDSRFQQRAPVTVQHLRHQRSGGLSAPGLLPQPRPLPVDYDLGNNTYDQANRLMQYERNSSLGNDVDGWQPPITGTMTVRLEAVDEDGNAFVALRPGMRFTVDDLASAEFAGDYLIDTRDGMTFNPPSDQEPLGSIEVGFVQYNAAAAVDVSDPPDDAYRTIASAALPNLGVSLQMANVAWVLVAAPVVTGSGGSLTVTLADLELQVLGRPTSTKYPGAVWTGVPSGTLCVLYLDDPGTGATMGVQTGGMPLTSPPADRYAILAGTFTSAGAVVFGPNYAEQEATW